MHGHDDDADGDEEDDRKQGTSEVFAFNSARAPQGLPRCWCGSSCLRRLGVLGRWGSEQRNMQMNRITYKMGLFPYERGHNLHTTPLADLRGTQ